LKPNIDPVMVILNVLIGWPGISWCLNTVREVLRIKTKHVSWC